MGEEGGGYMGEEGGGARTGGEQIVHYVMGRRTEDVIGDVIRDVDTTLREIIRLLHHCS